MFGEDDQDQGLEIGPEDAIDEYLAPHQLQEPSNDNEDAQDEDDNSTRRWLSLYVASQLYTYTVRGKKIVRFTPSTIG
jgi:hypothetical protein